MMVQDGPAVSKTDEKPYLELCRGAQSWGEQNVQLEPAGSAKRGLEMARRTRLPLLLASFLI